VHLYPRICDLKIFNGGVTDLVTAADRPDISRGGLDLSEAFRHLARPAWRREQEVLGFGSSGPFARRNEHVRPHVEQGQQVVAPVRVGYVDDQGTLGQIKPHRRVQSVEIGSDDFAEGGRGKGAHVRKRVGCPRGGPCPGSRSAALS
jgi:hypothetical protein